MAERFGPYLLLKRLGGGAMGDAHLARPIDPRAGLPSPVVIKRLHGELALQPGFVRRFKHEAEIATLIDSPNVARIYDVGSVGETLYIAMEFISGWVLSRIVENLEASRDRASILSAADVALGTLSGLAAIHGAKDKDGAPLGIVHRDISPKNLMIGEDGATRVIDLGLGKSRLQDWKTRTGAVMGTVGYMAPEQVIGGEVDHRADIYAAGVVLWELITGVPYIVRESLPRMLLASASPPFRPTAQFRSEVPPALDGVLEHALAIDASKRFQSAMDFHEALRRAVPSPQAQRPELWTLIGQMLWTELSSSRVEVKELLDSDQSSEAQTIVDQGTVVFSRRTLIPNPANDTLIKARPPSAVVHPPKPRSPLIFAGAATVAAIAVAAVVVLADRPQAPQNNALEAQPIPAAAPKIEARPQAPAKLEIPEKAPPPPQPQQQQPRSKVVQAQRPEPAPEPVPAAAAIPERSSPFARAPSESARAWVDRLIAEVKARRDRATGGDQQKLDLLLVQLSRHRASRQIDNEVSAIGALADQLAEQK